MIIDQWPYGKINTPSNNRGNPNHIIVDYGFTLKGSKKFPLVQYLVCFHDHCGASSYFYFFPSGYQTWDWGFRFEGYYSNEQLLTSDSKLIREYFVQYNRSPKRRMRNFPQFLEETIKFYGLRTEQGY